MSNSVHSHFGTCDMLCSFSKLPISRKVSTCFTCASFLMWSFLMWSNLVFPLAHLNILISAEFSLFSSFFFTAQHPEPYVCHFWSDDCFEHFVFQFHGHLPIAHHQGWVFVKSRDPGKLPGCDAACTRGYRPDGRLFFIVTCVRLDSH